MKSPNRCLPYTVTSFSNNVSSIYRRSHDLIIGGSIATINSTRSFPPLYTPFPSHFFFPLLVFVTPRKRAWKNFSRNGKNVVRRTRNKEVTGFVTVARNSGGGTSAADCAGLMKNHGDDQRIRISIFCFFFVLYDGKLFRWSSIKKKNNMEEKECDEFLDFIIIESTQSLNF